MCQPVGNRLHNFATDSKEKAPRKFVDKGDRQGHSSYTLSPPLFSTYGRAMLHRIALGLAFVLFLPLQTGAQGISKATTKAPVPRLRPEQTPGYKPMVMQGFTVLVSDETWNHRDDDVYEKKPLEVLEGELKTIVQLLPARTLGAVRGLLIWVEWDKHIVNSSGRKGNALATYYGGHQQNMLAKGMHPLQANTVTVHSMKTLTMEHQPQRDSGRCVLLHEIAHAVHDQVLGRENAGIKSGYKQAMDRKLMDPNAYASTNISEYFAEMTCAYFNQLAYYPRTRSDLKKHDPVTCNLMEGIWGKVKIEATKVAPTTADVEAPSLDELKLGQPVSGPPLSAQALQGRPCLVIYWNGLNISSLSSLTKVSAWDAELANFGLATTAVHLTGTKAVDVEALARARGLTFTVTQDKWRSGSLVKDFKDFPLGLVYGHDGRCVFRGNPFDAEPELRKAVGAALVAELDMEEVPKALAVVVESILKGKAPAAQFARLTPLTKSEDEETARAAEKLLAKMTENGRRVLEGAETNLQDDPVETFLALERLPAAFRDTPIATKANALLAKLKQDKAVAIELKARTSLATVKKLTTYLESLPGSFDPAQEKFQRANAVALRQLEVTVAHMKRTWPTTRATEQAMRTAEKFGVTIR
jgi:hypothetical protein